MKLAKKRLELASAIVAIVLSGLALIGSVYEFVDNYSSYTFILTMILQLGIIITTLTLSIMMITRSRVINGKVKITNGLKIAYLVFVSIYALSGFILLLSPLSVAGLIMLAPAVLMIVSMCLPNRGEAIVAKAEESFEVQIKELQRLKELEIIDEIQYKRAVEKIVEKI